MNSLSLVLINAFLLAIRIPFIDGHQFLLTMRPLCPNAAVSSFSRSFHKLDMLTFRWRWRCWFLALAFAIGASYEPNAPHCVCGGWWGRVSQEILKVPWKRPPPSHVLFLASAFFRSQVNLGHQTKRNKTGILEWLAFHFGACSCWGCL